MDTFPNNSNIKKLENALIDCVDIAKEYTSKERHLLEGMRRMMVETFKGQNPSSSELREFFKRVGEIAEMFERKINER